MNFQLDYRMRRLLLIAVICITSAILVGALIKLIIWEKSRGEKGQAPMSSAPAPASSTVAVVISSTSPSITPPPATPTRGTPTPSLSPTPLVTATPTPTPIIPSPSSPPTPLSVSLIIPVAGIQADKLRDTYTEARSEGRVHYALDIMAPYNSWVLAAADGKIIRLFKSDRGGVTIYQLSPDEKIVLYYAHLDRYADGLHEGKFVKQGELIAYVGDTGNAGAGNYHLHFGLWRINDPKRFWTGENINPYPYLKP